MSERLCIGRIGPWRHDTDLTEVLVVAAKPDGTPDSWQVIIEPQVLEGDPIGIKGFVLNEIFHILNEKRNKS